MRSPYRCSVTFNDKVAPMRRCAAIFWHFSCARARNDNDIVVRKLENRPTGWHSTWRPWDATPLIARNFTSMARDAHFTHRARRWDAKKRDYIHRTAKHAIVSRWAHLIRRQEYINLRSTSNAKVSTYCANRTLAHFEQTVRACITIPITHKRESIRVKMKDSRGLITIYWARGDATQPQADLFPACGVSSRKIKKNFVRAKPIKAELRFAITWSKLSVTRFASARFREI